MGAKTPKTSDRRVQRTRHALRQALLALLLERDWEAVSVQDVCDRADVGRSTFYVHFADKEDLLLGGIDELRAALLHPHAAAPQAGPLPFVRGLVAHAHAQRSLFRALVGRHGGQAVLRSFRELVVDLVRHDLAGLAPGGPHLEPAARFIAGGLLEVLSWWLESKSALGPDQIERWFLELSTPVMRVVQKRSA